jgi:hypothetical protein
MPAKVRLHYAGTYRRRACIVRARAYADPTTICWRCGRRLDQVPPHKTGRRARWTAGHVIDGDPRSELRAECSPCNLSAGAVLGNTGRPPGRNPHSRRW